MSCGISVIEKHQVFMVSTCYSDTFHEQDFKLSSHDIYAKNTLNKYQMLNISRERAKKVLYDSIT